MGTGSLGLMIGLVTSGWHARYQLLIGGGLLVLGILFALARRWEWDPYDRPHGAIWRLLHPGHVNRCSLCESQLVVWSDLKTCPMCDFVPALADVSGDYR